MNQRHYEALGEVITEYVYDLLESKAGLRRLELVPAGAEGAVDEPRSHVFVSPDLAVNQEKLLILIHGSGVVRAGQWARRLIVNEDLDRGTQLPFIERAMKEGYAVVVANTNDNSRTFGSRKQLIQGSENPVNHLLTVWRQVVAKSPAKKVAIFAFSYGGVCTFEMAMRVEDFTERVYAVALADSVHYIDHNTIPADRLAFLRQVGRNWVASGQPLDTPVQTASDDLERVSAGHSQHEMAPFSSMESVFAFLAQRWNAS